MGLFGLPLMGPGGPGLLGLALYFLDTTILNKNSYFNLSIKIYFLFFWDSQNVGMFF
jgi:hypothetical protein